MFTYGRAWLQTVKQEPKAAPSGKAPIKQEKNEQNTKAGKGKASGKDAKDGNASQPARVKKEFDMPGQTKETPQEVRFFAPWHCLVVVQHVKNPNLGHADHVGPLPYRLTL